MALENDITSYLSSVPIDRRLLLAKEALSKTYFGQKGLIKPIIEDGRLRFQSTYIDPLRIRAGQPAQMIADSLQEVAQYISGVGITEIADLRPGFDSPSLYRGYGQVLKDMNESLGLTGDQQIGAQIKIHKARAGSESIGIFLQEMKDRGTGLIFPTDEGGMALSFVQNGNVLTTEQTIDIMRNARLGLFTEEEFTEALKAGNKGLSKLFAKLPKRMKGVLSPREVSVSDDLLSSFLGKPLGLKSSDLMTALSEATLNVDDVFETLALAYGENTAKNFAQGTKQFDVAEYIKESFEIEGGQGPQQEAKRYVDDVLDEILYNKNIKDSAMINQIKNSLQDLVKQTVIGGGIDAAEGKYGIEILKNTLKNEIMDDDSKAILKPLFDLFGEMEKGADGSALTNARFGARLREKLQNDLDSMRRNTDEASIIKKIEIRRQLAQLTIDKNENVTGLSQVTLRGSLKIGEIDYSYKSATQFKHFSDRFQKYGIITSISGLKKETGIAAGTAIVNFSGLAESTSRVYADPMLAAFHDAIFGNSEDIASTTQYRKNVLQEFQAVLQNGRLTEDSEVLRGIRLIANQDMDEVLESQQFSKMLNRDYAQRILDLHKSGVSIKDSPEYLNLLKKYYQAELFKMKNGQMLPVVGDVYRFALNAEANAMTGTGGKKFLDGKAITVHLEDEAMNIFAEIDIAKIRVSNHNILFHKNDIRKFYSALGGFDLDDKGLPILGTYMSGGKRKLGAAMVRQPTGAGEIIGLTRFEDIESYRQIFGGNRFFMKTLNEMAEKDSKYKVLSSALDGTGMSDDLFNPNTMGMLEQLTIDVYTQMSGGKMRQFNKSYFEKLGVLQSGQNKIANYSAAALASLGAEDPTLMSLGFMRMKAEIEQMSLEDDVFRGIENILDPSQKNQLEGTLEQIKHQKANLQNLSGQNLDKAKDHIEELSKYFYDQIGVMGLDENAVYKGISKMFLDKSVETAIANTNILGQYVNRATFIGHGLRQFESAFKGMGMEQELLQKGLILGSPSAETIIDMTQTFTAGRMNMQYSGYMANSDPDLGMRALKALYGENTDLGELGRKTVEQYGKIFGYLSQKKGFKAIIDESFINSGKLKGNDLISLAGKISEGIKLADPSVDVSNLDKAVGAQNQDMVEEALRGMNFLGKGSLSDLEDVAKMSSYMLDSITNLEATAQITREQELIAKTTEVSRTAAENILSQNQALIDEIQMLSKSAKLEDAEEMDKFTLHLMKLELGDKLLSNVEEVQKELQIGGYELANAIQYTGIKKGISPDFFEKLPDSSMIGDERANLFYRYMDMAKQRSLYEKKTQNVALRNYIDQTFTRLSDDHRAGILDDSLDLDFANDFFGPNNRASTIRDILKNQNPTDATNEEKLIANALRSKVNYEQLRIDDTQIDAMVNGNKTSIDLTSAAKNITDETPSVVADTLRDLYPSKRNLRDTPYRRISKKYLAEQFSKPGVRNAAIGAGLAIAASFMYQNKKDHTKEDMSGPPLLPGGSAYESEYPKRMSEIPQAKGQGFTSGMNYRVSLFGDRDQIEKFSTAASGLTNGNINSTMYNRIPDVARDPYQSMARSY